MAEGGFDEDDVFHDYDTMDLPLLPYHESLAGEIDQAESDLSSASAHSPMSNTKLELLKDKVDSFYRSTGLNMDLIDYNRFTMNDNGDLFFIKK